MVEEKMERWEDGKKKKKNEEEDEDETLVKSFEVFERKRRNSRLSL